MSHKELINTLVGCKFVITDSGGIQEETTFLNKKSMSLALSLALSLAISLGISAELVRIDAGIIRLTDPVTQGTESPSLFRRVVGNDVAILIILFVIIITIDFIFKLP